MQCPVDLIFDDTTQQCEYIYPNEIHVPRMASLRLAKSLKEKKDKDCDCSNKETKEKLKAKSTKFPSPSATTTATNKSQ